MRYDMFSQEKEKSHPGTEEGKVEFSDAEMLDELTTSRGELKVRNVSFNEDRQSQVKIKFVFSF